MREYWFNIKDITVNNYLDIQLPVEDLSELRLNPNHEYLFCDGDIDFPEYISVKEMNEFLLLADETLSKKDLQILFSTYLFNEIQYALKNGNEFTIIDFDSETSQWNNGNGVIANDWWKGYLLHDLGYISFPFEYKEEMEDYVRFECLWTEANCDGWREVSIDNHTYLVKRW